MLRLTSAEAFVVDAEGRFGTLEGALGADASASGGDVHERYGSTPQARAALAAVLSGAEETTTFTLDRGTDHVEIRLLALRDEARAVSGAVGVVLPANERVRLELALAACEARLRQVVDSGMIGILFWDRAGAITSANDAFLRLVGYSRADLANGQLNWRSLTPPEHWGADDTALAEIDRSGACPPFEKEYLHKTGRRIPILIGGAAFDGDSSEGVCFVIDESERKEHERWRRDAEAQLRHAVNCTPFVLWSVDTTGTFTLSEGRGLEALGLGPGQVVGKSAFEFYAGVPQVIEALHQGLSGKDFTHLVEIAGRVFETRTFHLMDGAGRITGLVGMSLDVTERQRAEAERMRLQAKLLEVQRLESLGLMAGGIAHDFNNILTVILGNASTARLAVLDDEEARTDIDNVIAAGQRAADLTRQMLAYSGRGRFDARPLDVSALVRDIVGLIGTTLSRKVQLQVELATVPAVRGDAAQLQQVLMNIVINAIESCGDRPGSVSIRTSERLIDGAGLPDGGLRPGRHVCLEISDDGSGMDAATIAKIFDPFFTTKFTGRGLGLAAVLGIVRAHEGSIDVDSSLGRGSRFTVLLPSCDESTATPVRALSVYRGQGLVLVIDDDVSVRQIVAKMLTSLGFSVLDAAGGQLGLQALREGADRIALVLLDMTMPDMDGEETLRAIRQLSAVPVVLMSGYGESEAMLRFASQRPSGFLQKPFTARQMGEMLCQALEPGATGSAP